MLEDSGHLLEFSGVDRTTIQIEQPKDSAHQACDGGKLTNRSRPGTGSLTRERPIHLSIVNARVRQDTAEPAAMLADLIARAITAIADGKRIHLCKRLMAPGFHKLFRLHFLEQHHEIDQTLICIHIVFFQNLAPDCFY